MVLTIFSLSLNKFQGDFLVKRRQLKNGLFSFFLQKNPVETYRGLQGAKNWLCEFGWPGSDSTRHYPSSTIDFECKILKYIKLVPQFTVKLKCSVFLLCIWVQSLVERRHQSVLYISNYLQPPDATTLRHPGRNS